MALPNKAPGFVRLLAHGSSGIENCTLPFQDGKAPAPKFADGKMESVSLSLNLCRSSEVNYDRLVYLVDKLMFLPMLQVVGQTSGYISGLCSKTLPRSYFLNASHLQPATNKSHTGYLLTLHTQVTSSSCRFQASHHKNIHGTSSINNAQWEYLDIPYIKHSNM